MNRVCVALWSAVCAMHFVGVSVQRQMSQLTSKTAQEHAEDEARKQKTSSFSYFRLYGRCRALMQVFLIIIVMLFSYPYAAYVIKGIDVMNGVCGCVQYFRLQSNKFFLEKLRFFHHSGKVR